MIERIFGNRSPLTSVPWLMLCAFVLTLVGLLTLWSVTTVYGERPYLHVMKQASFFGLAALAGCVTCMVGHDRLALWSRPLLWVTWGLLLVVLFMPAQLGARRWIDLGVLNVQPSELAKLVMIVVLSAFCAARRDEPRKLFHVFLPGCAYMGITAALVLCEPDLGQTLFILALCLVILLVNGLRLLHVVALGALLLPGLVIFMQERFEYVRSRLDAFFSSNAGYQVSQGLKALAAGGAMGAGIGEGRAHLKFVPKIHNDFVMVAIGEQLGFVGSLLVVVLFLALLYHGLRIAFRARDSLGFSIAFGITFMIALQAAVNLAVVTDSVPPKGMSLPFVSYGGSSLVVLGASLGLLVSVAKGSGEEQEGRIRS